MEKREPSYTVGGNANFSVFLMFILHRMSRVLAVLAGRKGNISSSQKQNTILIFNCFNYYTRLTRLREGIFSL